MQNNIRSAGLTRVILQIAWNHPIEKMKNPIYKAGDIVVIVGVASVRIKGKFSKLFIIRNYSEILCEIVIKKKK